MRTDAITLVIVVLSLAPSFFFCALNLLDRIPLFTLSEAIAEDDLATDTSSELTTTPTSGLPESPDSAIVSHYSLKRLLPPVIGLFSIAILLASILMIYRQSGGTIGPETRYL